jgi:hypothetical protein
LALFGFVFVGPSGDQIDIYALVTSTYSRYAWHNLALFFQLPFHGTQHAERRTNKLGLFFQLPFPQYAARDKLALFFRHHKAQKYP